MARQPDSSGELVWQAPLAEVCKSELDMMPLSDLQIEEYLDSEAWMGKSGAFGYQDDHPWLKLVSGTADNVVGLPIESVKKLLHQAGFPE